MDDKEKKQVDEAIFLGATSILLLFIFVLSLAFLLRTYPNSNSPFNIKIPENVYGLSSIPMYEMKDTPV